MGIFREGSNLYTRYEVELVFRSKIMGGVPKDPKVIEAWIASKAGVERGEELRQMTLRTMGELGVEVPADASFEQIMAASKGAAAAKQTNGFKFDEQGLYIEGRQVKAGLKECINILFAGERWGNTLKGPKSFAAERVFPAADTIYLGVKEPTGVDLFIGHVSGPKGPQSSLTYIEYVQQPTVVIELLVAEDSIRVEHWPDIWNLAEELGFGALRSQGFGRFDVVRWTVLQQGRAYQMRIKPSKTLSKADAEKMAEEAHENNRLVEGDLVAVAP